MKKIICQVLTVVLLCGQLAWAESIPPAAPTGNAEQLFSFAQHLFEMGEYYRAITEYQRFIFLYPNDAKVAQARFQIGNSYFAGEEWKEAIKVWKANLDYTAPAELRQQTFYQIAASYYQMEQYSYCQKYLAQLNEEYPQNSLYQASQKLLILSYLKQERWHQATQVAQKMRLSEDTNKRIAEGVNLPQKDPYVAGALSAVLPGAGQLYTGRIQDGIVAFILNGLFIWGAVESFQHDKKVAGGILLFFETGWYLGNIYSAVNSAHKYNAEKKESLIKRTQERLQFKFGVSQATPFGLSLSYHF